MPSPSVYVLVLNWNGQEHLKECIPSLLASTYESLRVLLVDGASTDRSVQYVRETFGSDSRVEIVVCSGNLGWPKGNNVGLRKILETDADYIVLLNNDTIIQADALAKLVQMAEARPEIGALNPKILFYHHRNLINSLGLECSIIGCGWDRAFGRLDGPHWSAPQAVIGASGAALFLRRSALEKTGLLEEDFEYYLEDLDLGLRLWNAGYEIWTCPEAVVYHKFSATLGRPERFQDKYFYNARNRLYIILRHFPWSTSLVVIPASKVGELRAIGRAVLDGEFWKLRSHVRAWRHSAAYLPKAFRYRRQTRKSGVAQCRFWHLVRKDRMFFPGVEFPDDGWYRPVEFRGCRVRPMSGRAWYRSDGRKLRVTHANCYPDVGLTHVEVYSEGTLLASLQTSDITETVLDAPAGVLEFLAKQIFRAEETGERGDFGGWIGITPL
ncbi:MAG: glycosyltransferase family 2 protein [Candidatus Hydrogenedentes bacterium]|nr:glycosyltransferase family 2 protein [Candidatus Hydrogenedentota bacterium]